MSDMLPISDVDRDRVRAEVRALLEAGISADAEDRLRAFLASIDWSGTQQADAEVLDQLGRLEGWSTTFDERESDLLTYIGQLLTLLPENRDVTILLNGVSVTARPGVLTAVPAPAAGVRSVPRPQTELATREAALAL